MRQLPQKFQTIPKLAICCALGNVKPKGKTFTPSAEKAFVDLVDEKVMYAKVLHIDADVSAFDFNFFLILFFISFKSSIKKYPLFVYRNLWRPLSSSKNRTKNALMTR